ncbi:hypothetical protein JHK86_049358 [Glycine max]|nr:hypothetical protein JHK86_049358 [Glycine max]
MKTIVASYNITPNQPTPKEPLWLSDSDQIGVLGHVSLLYIYKSAKKHNTVERMNNSLSKLLSYYYPVAGRLSLSKSGRMQLDCNAKGEIPLLLVQLTRFHGGDQGLVIGVLLSHPLTDATGIVDFMNRWAKLARGEELDPNEIPFLDRTLLKFPHIPSSKLPDRWKPVPQSQVPGNDDGIDKQKKRSDRLDSRIRNNVQMTRRYIRQRLWLTKCRYAV